MLKYRVRVFGSERGWGQKTWSYHFFNTAKEMQDFIEDFNKDLPRDHTPDYYVIAVEDGTQDVAEDVTHIDVN